MTRTAFALWLCASGVIPGTLGHVVPAAEQKVDAGRRFKTGDPQLRELATVSPAPAYPPASLAKKVTGVVVAGIRFDPKGATEAVDVVQSPDADTGRAVHDTLMRWAFRPTTGMPGEGILFFYFHMKGRDGVVLSPAQMRDVINPGAKPTHTRPEQEPPPKLITEAEFRKVSTLSSTLLLDIRDRETFAEGHEKGAVNIPFWSGEILARAPAELPMTRHVVIDCRDPLDLCALAVHQLTSEGFSQVSVLRR